MIETLAAETPGQLVWMLYYSKSTIAGSAVDRVREYVSILDAARRNNPREDITGALMVSQGRFAQILEGPAARVWTRFERIRLDPRHRFTTVLKASPSSTRLFGAWSMGLASSSPGAMLPLTADTSLDRAIADPTRASDALTQTLLQLVQSSSTPGIAA